MQVDDDVHPDGALGPLMLGTGAGVLVAAGMLGLGMGWVFALLMLWTVSPGVAVLSAWAAVKRREGADSRQADRRAAEAAKWDEDLRDEELLAAQIRAEADRLLGRVQRRASGSS